MTPSNGSADEAPDHAFVSCPSCGSKAAASWSFCRSCQSSLDDARPVERGPRGMDGALDIGETGCPKCGHEEAEVDEIATTGSGLSRLFDVQTRRFRVVTCSNCGYSEFYRGGDADVLVDLFLG